MAAANLENMKISELFDKAWELQEELEKRDDARESEYIRKLNLAIQYLERCDAMIEEIHIFSDNEVLEEISTKELRYLICPALLAWLISKINYNSHHRLKNVEKTANFYLKFLKLTKDYKLHNFAIPNLASALAGSTVALNASERSLDKDLISSAYDRNEKIRRFKEQKEMEQQLQVMKAACKNEHVDDEQRRSFYMTCVKFWLNKSFEELKFAIDEIKLLKARENLSHEEIEETKNQPKPAPIKPYVLTKDALQAKVFGMGYPSLPVYSVDEFFDQLVDKGCMSQIVDGDNNLPVKIGGGVTEKQKADEKAAQDLLEDVNDEAQLRQQREWDEFKDDNKRGEGNRYNRS